MSFLRAGQLARFTPTARADDSLGLVAENLREARVGTIPVFDSEAVYSRELRHATLLGLVDERDLSGAVLKVLQRQNAVQNVPQNSPQSAVYANAFSNSTYASGATSGAINGATSGHIEYSKSALNGALSNETDNATDDEALSRAMPQAVRELKARDVMRRETGFVPSVFSLENALLALDRYDVNALPVIDSVEGYQGMISRADVVAALGEQIRPPVVGGMATPLGVWLTTGTLSGGAPPLGLVLSGVVLALCHWASETTILVALSHFKPLWAQLFTSGSLSNTITGNNNFNLIVAALQSFLFLLFVRLIPLSGTHAAEHQTVWAIEKGLPLQPEIVAKMPRPHPRCGTNLVALGGLILIIFQHLPNYNPDTILLALLFVYFFWRNFGDALQQFFTTKPATRKQLESGIRAGEEVLAKYQKNPHDMAGFGSRLLNSGIAYSSFGMIATISALGYLQSWMLLHWFK